MPWIAQLIAFAIIALALSLCALWYYSRKRHIQRLEKSLKIVFAFAATGFSLAWVLIAVYSVTPNNNLLVDFLAILCPTSIMSMALDDASVLAIITVWSIISVTNAAVYATVGILVGAVLLPFWKIEAPAPGAVKTNC